MQDAYNYHRPMVGRQAGVGLHMTSLPGRYGIGEIGESSYRFIDFMRRAGLKVWQFLPLGPTGYGDSPYQALSTFAGNEMLIDIGDLELSGLLHAAETEALTQLPAGRVDFGALIPIKTRLLVLAASRFSSIATSEMKSALDAFLRMHNDDWLHDYALFRVLKARHGERAWPEWPPEYARRDEQAIRNIEQGAAAEIERIKVLQFLFHDQWNRLRAYALENGIQLFGDLPLYIATDSADAWANRDIVRIDQDGVADCVAGVPPDYFSQDGQLWGNPLYKWEYHRSTGFRWWIDRLRATTRFADIVRIDHFRGFESYWAVPANAETARDGAWVSGVGDELFNAMKEAMGSLPVVAEDLGVITPEVEALRDRHGIPGMVVLQFKLLEDDFSLADVRENCVCYTGTHDNDTSAGWFHGSPDDSRSAEEIYSHQQKTLWMTGGSADSISLDLVKAAFSTSAALAIAPLQDYLGLRSDARFNIPGTRSNNWRWRVEQSQLDDALCNQIASVVAESGRGQA